MGSRYRPLLAIVIVAGLIGAVAAFWRVRHRPTPNVDPICDYVKTMHLDCPALLAGPGIMGPGAVTQLEGTGEDHATDPRVILPSSTLTKECLLPGQTLGLPEPTCPTGNEVALPTFHYDLSADFGIGADLPVPRLPQVTLKAGPHASNLRRIDLTATKGCVYTLDDNVLVERIESCALKPACVQRIKDNHDRVINNILVADDLSFEFFDKSEQRVSFEAGQKEGLFQIKEGGGSTDSAKTTLLGKHPVVIGVRFIREDVIARARPCAQTVIYDGVTGSSSVGISGGGGDGNIGGRKAKTADLGAEARLAASGSESSECDGGFERTRSSASANAQVVRLDDRSLRFVASTRAHGGHYATCATCAFNNCVGRTGHDNSATADAAMNGTIRVLVRSLESPTLRLTWTDMPDAATISVAAPEGRTALATMPAGGSSSKDVKLTALGTYLVNANVALSSSAGGGSGTADVNSNGKIAVEVISAGAAS